MKKVLVSFRQTCTDYEAGQLENTEALQEVYQFADELVSTTIAVVEEQEDRIESLTNAIVGLKLSAVERERVLHVINRKWNQVMRKLCHHPKLWISLLSIYSFTA